MVDVLIDAGFLRPGRPAQQDVGDTRLLESLLAGLERL